MNEQVSVSYDREIFLIQRYGGISNYFSHLIEAFHLTPSLGIAPQLTFSRSSNLHLTRALEESSIYLDVQKFFFQPKNWLETGLTLGPIRSVNSLISGGNPRGTCADLFHATYYRPQSLERWKSKFLAVTIHDFIPEKLGWNGLRNPHIGKKKLIQRSDLIICVSHQTRFELEERIDTRSKKVLVIPHGCSPLGENLTNSTHDKFVILYVGHRAGYKNFELLLKAFSIARPRMPDSKLLIAGPALSSAEASELNNSIGSSVWNHALNPSDDELRELYRTASVHVITSKMEGFGMTILESMSAGTKVLASDIPVFREVGGSESTYFDLSDAEDLAEKLVLEYEYPPTKKSRTHILNRAKQYSWSRSAVSHSEAYKSVIN